MVNSKFLKRAFGLSVASSLTYLGYGVMTGDEKLYHNLIMPSIHKLMDGENAHNLAILMAKYGLVPKEKYVNNEEILSVKAFNKVFKNPIGCAAGFDKNGEALDGLFKIGFGFVEIGTITPKPQEGNPRPRVFRLENDKAVINRYGFNSEGHVPVLERVKKFNQNKKNSDKVFGINIGKNKLSQDSIQDYLEGLKVFGNEASYLVINISSPNTPGLRSLQSKNQLEQLVDPILELRDQINKNLPILIKIAPDLNDQELKDIAEVSTRKNKPIDGLIISNTTISRPDSLTSEFKTETGGLSGRPLKSLSNQALKRMYELTNGKLTLIGVGGVESGVDVLEKIKLGASLVQLYTSMVYEGPTIVNKIKKELVLLLEQQGFSSISEAVGINVKNLKN